MLICIITVDPQKRDILEEKFSFLQDGGANEVKVCVFEKAKNYTYESDNNNEVIKSIYANTKACIAMGEDMTLVLQEDVELDSEEQTIAGLRQAKTFMDGNPDADMFLLGTHPNSRHTLHSDNIVTFSHAIHWQAVIFRVTLLQKLPETIPTGVHNDVFIAQRMTDDIQAYGLKRPVARQSASTKLRRRWEYQLLYESRCGYPYGDPLSQLMHVLVIGLFVVATALILI